MADLNELTDIANTAITAAGQIQYLVFPTYERAGGSDVMTPASGTTVTGDSVADAVQILLQWMEHMPGLKETEDNTSAAVRKSCDNARVIMHLHERLEALKVEPTSGLVPTAMKAVNVPAHVKGVVRYIGTATAYISTQGASLDTIKRAVRLTNQGTLTEVVHEMYGQICVSIKDLQEQKGNIGSIKDSLQAQKNYIVDLTQIAQLNEALAAEKAEVLGAAYQAVMSALVMASHAPVLNLSGGTDLYKALDEIYVKRQAAVIAAEQFSALWHARQDIVAAYDGKINTYTVTLTAVDSLSTRIATTMIVRAPLDMATAAIADLTRGITTLAKSYTEGLNATAGLEALAHHNLKELAASTSKVPTGLAPGQDARVLNAPAYRQLSMPK